MMCLTSDLVRSFKISLNNVFLIFSHIYLIHLQRDCKYLIYIWCYCKKFYVLIIFFLFLVIYRNTIDFYILTFKDITLLN